MTSTSSQTPEPRVPPRDPLASLKIQRPSESVRPRRRRRWIVPLILVLLLGIGASVYKYSVDAGWTPPAWMDANRVAGNWVPDIITNRPEVRLESVSIQTGRSGDAVVVATGYIESRRQARIGARSPGRIETINIEEGTRVKKDELLAVLEHADLDASLAAVTATVARASAAIAEQEVMIRQAQADLARAESLWNQRSVAESELDNARFAFESAKARKTSLIADRDLAVARQREAEQLKQNMFIRAPFDGTLISKDAEVGESILPGGMGEASGRGSVATIADLEHLEISCDVKEDYITRVREDQRAEISIDAVPEKKYHGRVRKIIPMGDRARATIKVQVAITDNDEYLFPEMSGTVFFLPARDESIELSEKPRMFVPAKAVVTDNSEESFVWTIDGDGRAKKLAVVPGVSRDGRAEIISGLSGDERIVTNVGDWKDGQPLKVIE